MKIEYNKQIKGNYPKNSIINRMKFPFAKSIGGNAVVLLKTTVERREVN